MFSICLLSPKLTAFPLDLTYYVLFSHLNNSLTVVPNLFTWKLEWANCKSTLVMIFLWVSWKQVFILLSMSFKLFHGVYKEGSLFPGVCFSWWLPFFKTVLHLTLLACITDCLRFFSSITDRSSHLVRFLLQGCPYLCPIFIIMLVFTWCRTHLQFSFNHIWFCLYLLSTQ